MADSCNFGNLLDTPCDKLLYKENTGRKNTKDPDDDLQCIFLWRVRLLEEQDNAFTIRFHHEQVFRKVFERKADKCCSILRYHRCNIKGHRVINEMTKILQEKGFNAVLPAEILCRKSVTEYEKLTKPPKNENMTENIETESSQDELASDDDFL